MQNKRRLNISEVQHHEEILLAGAIYYPTVVRDMVDLMHYQGYTFTLNKYQGLAEKIIDAWYMSSENTIKLNVIELFSELEFSESEREKIIDAFGTDCIPSLYKLKTQAKILKRKKILKDALEDTKNFENITDKRIDELAYELIGVDALKEEKNFEQIGVDVIEEIGKLFKSPGKRIQTGIPHLDTVIDGVYGQDIVVIGGYSGGGKSNLMTTIANNMVGQKKKVCFISNEDNTDTLLTRFVCSIAGISIRNLRSDLRLFKAFEEQLEIMKQHYSKYLTLLYIPKYEDAIAYMSHRAKGEQDEVYFVDYIQQFYSSKKHNDERERLVYMCDGFRDFKNKYNKPLFIAAQITKEQNKVKHTDSFSGSQAIRNIASIAMVVKVDREFTKGLTATNKREEYRKAKINIVKSRFGELGNVYGKIVYPNPNFQSTLFDTSENEDYEFDLD